MKNIMEELQACQGYDIILTLLIALSIACVIWASYLAVTNRSKGFTNGKRRRSKFLIRSYLVFSELKLSKRYVDQMRRRYEMLCPEDIKSLMCRTMEMCYLIWLGSAVILSLLIGLKPSLFYSVLAILAVGVFNHEYLEGKVGSMELKLMNQMDKFLSDTRHSFYKHGMIDEAIADAADKSGRIMKLNAVKIQNVLNSNDQETAIRQYNESISNRFLRMFLSVAVYVSEFGDKLVDGVSILLLNIHTLKSDIYIEIMNRKDMDHKFSGMVFISLAPVYLIEPIKKWALSTSPELYGFYYGSIGTALVIVIFILTVIIYVMINELKERNTADKKEHSCLKQLSYLKPVNRILNNYAEKNRDKLESQEELLYRVGERLTAKQFLLKRLLYASALFGLCILATTAMHMKNKELLVSSSKFTSANSAVIPDKMVQPAAEAVLNYMTTYNDLTVDREKIEAEIRKEGFFRSDLVRTCIVDEIEARLDQYNKEFFHWYELIFALLSSVVGYWFPYWMLLYKKKILKLSMGNEVALYQSTILLVMNLDTTTVLKVLELMEAFSVIFKESIKSCINDYASGDLDALEKLKMRERYEPFRRLVDNLIIADKIGIQRAFDEVAEERKVSQEMRNQEYRISRDKKVIIGTILSYIPTAITVALYWVVPFTINALSGLQDYDTVMNAFK